MRFLLLLFLIIASSPIQGNVYSSLTRLETFAKSLPEKVIPDNNNWLHPIFETYHKGNLPNLFGRMSQWFGISTKTFNIGAFEPLLKTMVEQREKEKEPGIVVEQFKPEKDDTFFIWTDLFGAFHSLIRDLAYLKERKIIDDSLKIIKPQYYFVFNGNIINGSPYILETLGLVLELIKRNPSHVFYVRGSHEIEERWHNFELIREIKIRAGASTKAYSPMVSLLDRFFETLPIGLFLVREKKNKINCVLIGNNDKIKKLVRTDSLSHLLEMKQQRGTFLVNQKRAHGAKEQNKKPIALQSVITGEDRVINFRATEGLSLVGAFEGATEWLAFSSPTTRNQMLYQFYYDAFIELHVLNGFKKWTIALINQDIRKMEGFQEAALFNLATGREIFLTEEKRKAKVVNFGSTMDLSKGASPVGKKVKEGLELAFDRELVTNRAPKLVAQLTTVDDEYTPHKTRGAVEDLVKDKITILIGSQGSPSLEAYLDKIENRDVLVLFPFTGSPLFRKPELKNLLHYRGSYIREGQELVDYALKNLKSKKIAIFYQDDAFGRGALEGAREALHAAGIKNYVEVPHERNVVNYKQQAQRIKEENPDTILFSTNALAIRGLIRQLGVQYFAGKKLLGLSVYEDAFERFLKDKGLEFVLIRMVPDPATSDLQIAREYREWADRKNILYDKVSFEQFINANILFEILKKIEGPITKEKILEIGEGFDNYPFKGLVLTFNPETRELSNTLWIDPGAGEWLPRYAEPVARKQVTPAATKVRLKEKPLAFGSTLDLSKGIKSQGIAVRGGLEMRLKQAKEQQLKVIPQLKVVDDEYTPAKTSQDVEKFISEGIRTIVCPVGSPTLESYLNLVNAGDVTVFFPITGAPLFRKSNLNHMIHLRASYATEGRVLSRYALDTLHGKKLAILYQNDAFGMGLLNASTQFLQERHFDNYLTIPYERNSRNFEGQVEKIMEYNPDAILFFSTGIATEVFLEQYGFAKARTLKLIGNSDFGEIRFQNFISTHQIPFKYVNVMPNPKTSKLEIVEQFNKACAAFGKSPDIFSLEAYVGMDLLLSTMQEIPQPVNRGKIMERLSSIKDKEYKGLRLKFDPETRTLLHTVWMNEGSANWKKIEIDLSDQ